MIFITLITFFIVYGQSKITSLSFDNENNINGEYINPNVDFTLYLTAEIDTSFESVTIEIYEDVSYWSDSEITSYTAVIKNGINEIKLTLDPTKFEESSNYYFKINSEESKSRFYVSSNICPSSCSLCSSSGICLCNVPHCASNTCSSSDTCSSCETDYKVDNGKCVLGTCFRYSTNEGKTFHRKDAIPIYVTIERSTYVGKIAKIYIELKCSDCSKEVQQIYSVQTTNPVVSGNKINIPIIVPETAEFSDKYYYYIKVSADELSTYCFAESLGYYFSVKDSSIECTDPKCIECSSSDYCTSCISGYTPSNGQCVDTSSPIIYGDKNGCDGTVGSGSGTCGDGQKFKVYTCSGSCKDGYNTKSQICDGTVSVGNYCEKIECTDSKCTECSSSDYCTSCISGYTPSNGQCIKDEITCTDSKCMECSSSDYCTRCISGYTPNNGQCIKDSNDNVYGDPNGCNGVVSTRTEICNNVYMKVYECTTSCKTGYTTESIQSCANSGSYDYCEKIQCNVDNCKTCSSIDYCYECYNPYYVSNGECKEQTVQCPSNCYSCTSSDYCDICDNGYKKDGNGGCIIEQNSDSNCQMDNCKNCYYSGNEKYCDECEKGYYIDYNYECQKCSDHCLECESKYCDECENNYVLSYDSNYGADICKEVMDYSTSDVYCYINVGSCEYDISKIGFNSYQITTGTCHNSYECSSSMKIIGEPNNYSIIYYPKYDCDGTGRIESLTCWEDGSEKLFMILAIILIVLL